MSVTATEIDAQQSGSSRPLAVALATAVVAIVLDQASKYVAVTAVSTDTLELVGSLRLRLVANRGGLLGIPMPSWLLIVAAVAVVAYGIHALRRTPHPSAIALGAIAGGAVGNLVDRLIHRPSFPSHAVVDWISVRDVATFNVADLLIMGGIAVLIAHRSSGDHRRVAVA